MSNKCDKPLITSAGRDVITQRTWATSLPCHAFRVDQGLLNSFRYVAKSVYLCCARSSIAWKDASTGLYRLRNQVCIPCKRS